MSEKTFKKMNYHADAKTLAAIAVLKEHHISISGLVQDTIQKKAEQLMRLNNEMVEGETK